MNGTRDTDETETADDYGGLDPREAARLLEQTRREAQRHAIVYGIYPVTAQLIVLGTFGAAIAAAREDWPALGVGIAVVLVAAGSAFAGSAGVWLSDGVGCCVAVLGYSAAQAWLRHR